MPTPDQPSTIYTRDFRLGGWLVRPSLNRLERDGQATQIEPKAMDVLVERAEHAGQVRSKNRLLRVVWGEAFVTDDVLTQAIRLLRRALEEDAKEPTYIETIPKRGYRLIAPVTREPGTANVRATAGFSVYETYPSCTPAFQAVGRGSDSLSQATAFLEECSLGA
jgi:DNA-binding winged helix-turn-helix (wHTH) protein